MFLDMRQTRVLKPLNLITIFPIIIKASNCEINPSESVKLYYKPLLY